MLSKLFDPQVAIFAGLTALVILIALIVLAVVSRRVRFLMSEMESLRRDVGLVDEMMKTLAATMKSAHDRGVDTDPVAHKKNPEAADAAEASEEA